MSNTVDNRVVQLEMENGSFEKNANQSIKTLNKLDNALEFKNGKRSFSEVEEAAAKCGFKPMLSAADSVITKFSAIEVAGIAALANLTNKAVNAGVRIAKSLSIDQITTGFSKYEQKTANVQTLINSTGKSIDEVNGYLDRLMWFSDETSYGFTDMTQALSTMVSAGGDIDKLVPMIEGMANATAFAGKGASEFNRVIYNLNQSYSQGFLNYMDWKSVQLAGASSKQLVETLIRAGEEAGTIQKGEVTVDNFTNTLSKKWATREVMENAFGYFDEMTQKAYEMIGTLDEQGNTIDTASRAYEILSQQYNGVSINSAKAAQEAKSFTEAIDSTKDAVSSGWMRTFDIIFGNYEQAKTLWTDVANGLWDIFAGGFEERNNLLEDVFQTSPVDNYAKSLKDAGIEFDDFKSKMKAAYRENTMQMSDQDFEKLTSEATTFDELLRQSWVNSNLLERVIGKYPKSMSKATSETKKFSGNLKDILKDVNSGKYGYGLETQQKKLIEAGFDGSSLGSNWLQQWYNAASSGNEEVVNSINDTLSVTEKVNSSLETQTDIFDDLAKKAKEFDNGYYSQNTGRTIMLDGLKNILGAVGDRLGVVKDSFDKAFPAMTAEHLKNIIITFHSFTEQLKMGTKEGEKISAVADRFFTILSKGKDVLGSVGRVGIATLKFAKRMFDRLMATDLVQKNGAELLSFLDSLYTGALAGMDSLIDGMDILVKYLDNAENLTEEDFAKLPQWLQNSAKFAKKLYNNLKPIVLDVGSFLKSAGGWMYNNVLTPFGNFIQEVINSEDPIGTLINGVTSFGEKCYSYLKSIYDTLKTKDITSILDDLKNRFPGVSGLIGKVSAAFKKLTTNADGTKKALDFSKVIPLITFGILILAIAKIGKALSSVQKAADSVTKVFTNLNNVFFAKFGNTFANNVLTVALAVVALAASLYLIANIPSENLKDSAKALGILMTVLVGLAALMTFVSKKLSADNLRNIQGLVKPILAMSAAILILSVALKNASKALEGANTTGEIVTRVIALLALIGGLGLEIIGLAALMSLVGGKVTVAAVVMVVIAAAILKMATALDKIQNLKLSQDAGQLIIWAGIIAMVIGIANAVGNAKVPVKSFSMLTNVVVSLAALAGGIYLALLAVEKLKNFKLSDLNDKVGEIVAVIVAVTLIGVAVSLIGKFVKPVTKAMAQLSVGVLALVGAMYLITLLMDKISKMGSATKIDSLASAIGVIGLIAVLMTAALGLAASMSGGGKGVLKVAVAVLAMTIAIGAMIGLMKIADILFAKVSIGDLLRLCGIIAVLALILGLLAIAVGKAGALGGGKGLGVLVASIAGMIALAAVLVVLTSFTWSQIRPALLAILRIAVALGGLMLAIGKAVQWATMYSGGAAGLFAAMGIVLAIGASLAILSNMPLDGMAYACVAMAAVMLSLAVCLAGLSKIDFSLKTFGNALVGVGILAAIVAALIFVMPAMEKLASLPTDQFLSNMLILGVAVAVLAAVVVGLGLVVGHFAVAIPALVVVAVALVAIGALFVAFAASMAVLANVNYDAIVSGLTLCAEPMAKVGGSGILMILGAVGVALFAGAIVLLGLASQSAAGGVATFSVAIEYLLGIFSAVGSAIQNNNGNILGALADLNSELADSADGIEKNSEKLGNALRKVLSGTIVNGEGIASDIGNGFAQAGDSILEQGDAIADAATTTVETAGSKVAEEATTQGETTGNNFIEAAKAKIKAGAGNFNALDLFGSDGPTTEGTFDISKMFPDMSSMLSNMGIDTSILNGMGMEDASTYIQGFMTQTQSSSEQTGEAGKAIAESVATSTTEEIQSHSDEIGSSLQTMLQGAAAKIDFSSVATTISGGLMGKIGDAFTTGQGDSSGGDGASSGFMEKNNAWFTNSFGSIDFSSIGDGAGNTFVEQLATSIQSDQNTGAVQDAGKAVGKAGKSGVKSVDITSSGVFFGQGFINGMKSMLQPVIDAATELGSSAVEALQAAIQQGSPSKLTKESGKFFGEGFVIAVNMQALYAAAAAYNMGMNAVEGLNEGIQNGGESRITPVLDMSDVYSGISDFDGVYRPVIKPTLDMSDADPAFRNMTAVAVSARESAIPDSYEGTTKVAEQPSYVNFTQNNYSPKALSDVEIYRQTRNQLNSLERKFKKK